MKNILRLFGRILLIIFLVFIVFITIAAIWFKTVSPGKTTPYCDNQGKIIEGSIAEIQRIQIGGIEQFLIIRGKNRNNPVLLMLHGGPGSPQAHLNLLHNKLLEDYFVVVNWDQRGAGGSYHNDIPLETMTVNQFVQDTKEVTHYLKNLFQKDKIFLLGHSWGSYLGMRTIYAHPDDYIAYIGIGQVSDQIKSEALSYQFVLEQAKSDNNQKALEELLAIGAPENGIYKDMSHAIQIQRKWVIEYGGAAFGKTGKDFFPIMLKPLLLFREYTISDKINYVRGMLFSQKLLWKPMITEQLVDVVKEVKIPVYILQGRHDYQTVFSLAQNYIDSLKAPSKEFIVFENSAHLPPYNNEIEKFHQVMIEKVLKNQNK